MISLIICARQTHIDPELEENIRATAGVPVEIISIDNSTGKYGICAAYNLGARQSRYDKLCFMHDDIRFHSAGWGLRVIEVLDTPGAGVVGVAGSVVSTRFPSPWWISNYYSTQKYWRGHLLQYRGQTNATRLELYNPRNERIARVATLDGLWLCCNRSVWADVQFDEVDLPGFHFYDLDFSLSAAAKGYYNYALFDVLLEHRSAGSLDEKWLKAADSIIGKWSCRSLPVVEELEAGEQNELEFQAIRNYLTLSSQFGYGSLAHNLRRWLLSLRSKSPGIDHLRLLKMALKNGFLGPQ